MLNLEKDVYELRPSSVQNQKSFYGKALVAKEGDGTVLYSYLTKIYKCYDDGTIEKYWDGWSNTTGRHIKAFCGLNKKQFDALPLNERVKKPRPK